MLAYKTNSYEPEESIDVVEVFVNEIFEMENPDILNYLACGILADHPISITMKAYAQEIFIHGNTIFSAKEEQVEFCKRILEAVEAKTGYNLKYALRLSDFRTMIVFFGRNMSSEDDYDVYKTGPVVLLHIDSGRNIYGYEDNPVPIDKRSVENPLQLPKGWYWKDYDDGSGSLYAPDGTWYFGYDLSPYSNCAGIEYQKEKDASWDIYWGSLAGFKARVALCVKDSIANNVSMKEAIKRF